MILMGFILLHGCMGQGAERNRLFQEAKYSELTVLVEKEIGESTDVKTSKLFHLCYAYAKLKRYDRLFHCTDQIESNIRRGDNQTWDFEEECQLNPYICERMKNNTNKYQEILSALNNRKISFMVPATLRAEAYIDFGQYNRAIEEFKKYDYGDQNVLMQRYYKILGLGALGLAYALNGDREESFRIISQIKMIGTYGEFWSIELDKTIALARIYMALNEFQDALDILQHDRLAFERGMLKLMVNGPEFIYVELPIKFMLAKCLMETGKINEAKAAYDHLLQLHQTLDNREIYWIILFDRGRIAEKEKNIKEAIKFYEYAVDIIEQQRSNINTEASKIGFVGDKQAVYRNILVALYNDKQYEKAFEYMERSKSRALVDLLASKKDFAIRNGFGQEIRDILIKNESAESELIIQDTLIDKNKTRSIQIKAKQDLRTKSPELASLVTVTVQPFADLKSFIPKGENLIEYYYYDRDMFSFILSHDGLKVVKLDNEGLQEDLRALRKCIETPESIQYKELSNKLYKRLFLPLEGFLSNSKLIIVPHGILHYLPINALYDGENYLIDRYSIRMMPNASVMKYLQDRPLKNTGGILVFGNPDLGNRDQDLIFAQKEAMEIANIRTDSKVFLRREATETVLRLYGNRYNYIHFATHGQFNPEAPLKSALLLAPDSQSNGMLTVDKLYSLRLDTNLVTLSACETGLSKIANGDDLVGLTRGFLYAGSSSIVASLWKVDDLATSELMVRFYKEMDKTDKREALRTAQLETKKKYPHPYYWASFQLTGNAN
jgi:CHAT domain-containing protein